MTATVAQIRAGLNTRLATISGLQTYAYLPGDPAVPCAFVGSPRETNYHRAHQDGLTEYVFALWALVSTAPPAEESQADLDEFVSPTGSRSIKAAVEGDPTLAGAVSDLIVESMDGYAVYVTEKGSWFGAQLVVRIAAGA